MVENCQLEVPAEQDYLLDVYADSKIGRIAITGRVSWTPLRSGGNLRLELKENRRQVPAKEWLADQRR